MINFLRLCVLCTLMFFHGTPSSTQAEPLGTWSMRSEGSKSFAAVQTAEGVTVIISFEAGARKAQMFVTGLWKTKPLDLRLWVAYANGKRGYIDTFRFADVLDHRGKTAYRLELPFAQLAPLRGGDSLVIEDLKHRIEVPLNGSAKAISTARQKASAS